MASLEPDPKLWLTPERCQHLQQQFASSAPLLRQAGLWRAALGYWVRWQASLDAQCFSHEEQAIVDKLEREWLVDNTLKETGLSTEELRAKLRVAPAVAQWSRQQWSHRLESLYLLRKSQLDRASCSLLRIREKNLIQELYHRIKSGESSFDAICREFGEGPERQVGGLIPLQPLERMPSGLGSILERMEPGRLSPPFRLDEFFCVVRLETFQPCQLDERTEDLLLAEQLRLWIDAVVDLLVADLGW
jgi:parvulin-like peptidyl-prolyl isomerase